MKNNSKTKSEKMILVSDSQEFKDKIGDWSERWYKIRKRHPLFLFHNNKKDVEGVSRNIDGTTVEVLKKFGHALSDLKIDVIIDSPGGDMDASFKSTLIFQSLCNYVAVVPRLAKSGATLFTLGASEIIMGKWAELGPLDPQIESIQTERHYFREQESALESFHAARFAQREVLEHLDTFYFYLFRAGLSAKYSVFEAIKLIEATIGRIYPNVNPFELGSSGRILEVMKKYCIRIMKNSYASTTELVRERVAHHLVWDYPSHDFYIDLDEAKSIGLKVTEAELSIQKLLNELEPFYGKIFAIGLVLKADKKVAETKEETKASNDMQATIKGNGKGKEKENEKR